MVTKTAIPVLVAGMLVTGISNSLFNKYQDMQCVDHCDDPDLSRHVDFSQPVWQTATMFLGELLCLVPVIAMHVYHRYVRSKWTKLFKKGQVSAYAPVQTSSPDATPRNSTSHDGDANGEARALLRRSHSEQALATAGLDQQAEAPMEDEVTTAAATLFFMPALCDICGTTLMNVGLLFTPVSIYQMTRGALVLWVGVFSVIFLRRSLHLFQWLCLALVMLGVSIVGLSGTMLRQVEPSLLQQTPHSLGVTPETAHDGVYDNMVKPGDEELPEAVGALLGVVLILFAQIFTASQFVLEEKIMGRYPVEPLMAVGMEGFFGLLTTLTFQVILHFAYGRTPDGRGGYFDMTAGWRQIIHTPIVLYTSFAIAASIALFNFFGLSVTRNISATARSTIDTCRTLGIWVVSLALGWEVFRPLSGGLQILGFCFLCYGTLVFNSVIRPPKFLRPRRPRSMRNRSRTRSRSRQRIQRSNTTPISQSVGSLDTPHGQMA
jgi:drug/metabolite transporter (DMT)-like permease